MEKPVPRDEKNRADKQARVVGFLACAKKERWFLFCFGGKRHNSCQHIKDDIMTLASLAGIFPQTLSPKDARLACGLAAFSLGSSVFFLGLTAGGLI
jgi:hypothetical protein